MMDSAADFGTGLRAHLGLQKAELELAAAPDPRPEEVLSVDPAVEADADQGPHRGELEALEALELELVERGQALARREAALAGRAGALLAAAQALYHDVLGGDPMPNDDELKRLRRRKSVA